MIEISRHQFRERLLWRSYELNPIHGHAAGDLLLIEVAQRIKACVREVDTVARLGGDEFVVLIQELSSDCTTSTEQVSVIAEKIRFLLSQPYRLMRGRPGHVPGQK